MLELAGGVGLGVDIADLLQLQGAFERDRIVHAAAEEERVLLARELLAPGDDLRLEREHRLHRHRQVPERGEVRRLVGLGQLGRAAAPCDSVSRNSATSCVVNALVEATPISMPARVR